MDKGVGGGKGSTDHVEELGERFFPLHLLHGTWQLHQEGVCCAACARIHFQHCQNYLSHQSLHHLVPPPSPLLQQVLHDVAQTHQAVPLAGGVTGGSP